MTGLFLAIYHNDVSLGQAIFVSIFSMTVVFAVLFIISCLIDVTAFFIGKSAKPKKANGVVLNAANTMPVNTKNDDSSMVAAITAAVAVYLGTSVDNIRISKIRRVGQDMTAWGERGLLAQMNRK